MSEVIHGDCLDVMRAMPAESFDLVYLDPPFFTGSIRRHEANAFDDRWDDIESYLAFMRDRLQEIHRLLCGTGSILLHCDWRTSHHLRLELDRIFGASQVVNHLVWQYGLGGSSPRGFARKHDDILFYARGDSWWFEPPQVPARSNRLAGQMKKATDVLDIPAINNMAHERAGWPTQKPLALLDMLVGACCPPQGRVLDPFCGSGTTLVSAVRLGRSATGIDINPDAIRISTTRLQEAMEPTRG